MKCEKENKVARACITTFRERHRSRVPCILAHPLSSFLFATPEISALKRLDNTPLPQQIVASTLVPGESQQVF